MATLEMTVATCTYTDEEKKWMDEILAATPLAVPEGLKESKVGDLVYVRFRSLYRHPSETWTVGRIVYRRYEDRIEWWSEVGNHYNDPRGNGVRAFGPPAVLCSCGCEQKVFDRPFQLGRLDMGIAPVESIGETDTRECREIGVPAGSGLFDEVLEAHVVDIPRPFKPSALQKNRELLLDVLTSIREQPGQRAEVSGAAGRLIAWLQGAGNQENAWFRRTATISFDQPEQVSYPHHIHDVDSHKARRRARWVTFLKRCRDEYGFEITDREAEFLAGAVRVYLKGDSISFRVVSGRELANHYRRGRYSCMRGTNSVRFYEENPHRVALLVIEQDGRYGEDDGGRALLWNTDQGDILVDRVYDGGDPIVTHKLLQLVAEKGWRIRWGWWGGKNFERVPEMDWPEEYRSVCLRATPLRSGYPYLDSLVWDGTRASVDETDTHTILHWRPGDRNPEETAQQDKFFVREFRSVVATDGGVAAVYPEDFVPTLEQPFPVNGRELCVYKNADKEIA